MKDLPVFAVVCWIPFLSALTLYCFKVGLIKITEPFFRLIVKDQDNQTKLNARAERAAAATYKLTFYIFASVSGYVIMKDTPVLPTFVGGSGSIEGIFAGMPY